ncbi:SDR family NAD(P)-dependent oxidoreductase [Larkinella terrae]|uniref:SDR family NAD(P)-dependent oxidoreductase n=1 Tax=Larkinella terrae TaxID=2025311 RepID=A0A7K0EML5_9BACT|nr:SDR family oxidoreductase [Larkinella terrae]MRS63039.1 SDR family NAD(P)-dependent oxidoreductase [Larkinella terrae]
MDVTLITGASGGIGEALATQLAARKHNLLLVARSADKLDRLCTQLAESYGVQANCIPADLSKPEAAGQIYEECRKKKLTVTLLINNAGIGSSGEFVKNDRQAELEMLQLNNASLVALCHLFLPNMIASRKGGIINVASLAAFFPSPYMAVYAASKVFVRSFTEALTQECKPYGIRVLLFSPGFTSTNFMNTPANDNAWGKALTDGAYTQTAQQVAIEMIQAWEKNETFHVSGRLNAWSVRLGALIPNATIARLFASRKRKQMSR